MKVNKQLRKSGLKKQQRKLEANNQNYFSFIVTL